MRYLSSVYRTILIFCLLIAINKPTPTFQLGTDDPRSIWDLDSIRSVPFDLRIEPTPAGRYEVEFTSEVWEATKAPLRIFGVLTVPSGVDPNNSAPAVLLVHGFGGTHAEMLGLSDRLARIGYISFAIDRPGRGNSGGPAKDWPNDVNVQPTPKGSYSYHSVVAMIRALQYLSTRSDVKVDINGKKLLGVVGVSRGGVYALLQSCIDPNVQASVAIIAAGSFDESADDGASVSIGIRNEAGSRWPIYLQHFDPLSYAVKGYQLAPVLITIGTNDDRDTLRAVNRTYNAFTGEKEIVLVANYWHGIHSDMISATIGWLNRHLTGTASSLAIDSVEWAYDSASTSWEFKVRTTSLAGLPTVMLYHRVLGGADWSDLRFSKLEWTALRLESDSTGAWKATLTIQGEFLWFLHVKDDSAPYPNIVTTQVYRADPLRNPTGSVELQAEQIHTIETKTPTSIATSLDTTETTVVTEPQNYVSYFYVVVAPVMIVIVLAFLVRRRKPGSAPKMLTHNTGIAGKFKP